MTNNGNWITVSDAAEVSGYNEEHVRRLLRDGSIVGRKFGIVWQVKRSSMLSYLSKAQSSDDRRQGPKEKPLDQ